MCAASSSWPERRARSIRRSNSPAFRDAARDVDQVSHAETYAVVPSRRASLPLRELGGSRRGHSRRPAPSHRGTRGCRKHVQAPARVGGARVARPPRSHLSRLATATRTPQDVRDPCQGRAFRPRVAERAIALGSGAERVDGLVDLVGQVALVRVPLEEGRTLVERKILRMGERASILCRRLSVRPNRRCVCTCKRSEPQHGVGVARRVRVVREPRRVRHACRRLGERCERVAMEGQPTPRLYRFLDREPGELVTKGDRARPRFDQHPRAQTFLETRPGPRTASTSSSHSSTCGGAIATASSSAVPRGSAVRPGRAPHPARSKGSSRRRRRVPRSRRTGCRP